MEQMKQEVIVPEYVKNSEYGCRNCLWSSCECIKGSSFKEDVKNKKCVSYTYYD